MNEVYLLPLLESRVAVAVAVGVLGGVFLTVSPSRDKPAVKLLAGSAVLYGLLQLLVLAIMRLENLPDEFMVFGTSVASIPVLLAITAGLEAYAQPGRPLAWKPVLAAVLALWGVAVAVYVYTDGWPYSGSLATSVWAGATAVRAFYWARRLKLGLLAWFGVWLGLISLGLWPVLLLDLPVELYRSVNIYPSMFAYATIAAMFLRQDAQALKDELRQRQEAQEALHALTVSLEQQVVRKDETMTDVLAGLSQVASLISHDLRSPVRNAAYLAEAALHELAQGKDLHSVKEYLELILRESKRGGAIVNDILTLAKVQQGALQIQKISLDEVVRDVLKTLEADFGPLVRKVQVKALPELEVDPALMRRVFTNVIGNALKFGKHLPHLSVEVMAELQPQSEVWFFEVRDNGPGFDGERAEDLFKPFVKLSASNASGSGLGLPMVKRIIESHQGMVGANSALGQGANFWWTLPTSQPNSQPDMQPQVI